MAVDVLDGLDPEQRAVAMAARGPVCVLAGAGTGKTRAITRRIAYATGSGMMDPGHVLALTFTVRAAGELRGRLRELGAGRVRASTFHAAALRQLNYFWPKIIGGRPPRLVDGKAALIREAAEIARARLDSVSDVAAEIEWAKTMQLAPEEYPAAAAGRAGPKPELFAAVYAGYEKLRRERHLIDFESVLELTAAMIFEYRLAADQVRQAFRYFVVDEYQDVNPLQKLLLDAWLGGRDDLCVVGDPHQTIYTFTGATPGYLTGFTTEFPGATVVRLIRDYRSTPQVVAVANQLIKAERPLLAQRPGGPAPLLTQHADEQQEAEAVAVQIRALIAGGVPVSEIAILVRVNAHTERFEQALAKTGVPYLIRGSERFYDRPVVKQALMLIRGAARGQDPAGAQAAGAAAGETTGRGRASSGAAGSGAAGSTAGGALAEEIRHILTGMGFTGQAPPAAGARTARERWESLSALLQLAEHLGETQPDLTLAGFAAELTQRAELGHAPAAAGVTLASMHAAKGLEWDAVLLPGLVEGVLPIGYARTPEAIEEERRLLYVAVTRAREHLYLSWAPYRAPGGSRGPGQNRVRSRFLDGIRI